MPHLLNNTLAPIDTSWFDADPEAYLTRPDFLEFQELAGIDLRDLFSMVGVICGLNDRAALTALKLAHRILGGGVVSSLSRQGLSKRSKMCWAKPPMTPGGNSLPLTMISKRSGGSNRGLMISG